MNVIPATVIKRRGVVGLEECLKYGPVHIIKNNRPTCAVLSEEEYQKLKNQISKRKRAVFNLSSMLEKPATGKKTRKQIDKLFKEERDSWE